VYDVLKSLKVFVQGGQRELRKIGLWLGDSVYIMDTLFFWNHAAKKMKDPGPDSCMVTLQFQDPYWTRKSNKDLEMVMLR